MPRIGFLLYDSRSGSTFLSSLLNGHPDIAVSHETQLPVEACARMAQSGAEPRGSALLELVEADSKLQGWGPEALEVARELAADTNSGVSSMVQGLVERLLLPKKPGAKLAVIKQGGLAWHQDMLLKLWPDAFFIHIVRDGRAVFASKKRTVNIDTLQPMQTDPKKAAHRWVRYQAAIAELKCRAPVYEVRYEDLITNQDAALERLFTAMGLGQAHVDEAAVGQYVDGIPGDQKKIHTKVAGPADTSRIHSWKCELGKQELKAYEQVAFKALHRAGYEPTALEFKLKAALDNIKVRCRPASAQPPGTSKGLQERP